MYIESLLDIMAPLEDSGIATKAVVLDVTLLVRLRTNAYASTPKKMLCWKLGENAWETALFYTATRSCIYSSP